MLPRDGLLSIASLPCRIKQLPEHPDETVALCKLTKTFIQKLDKVAPLTQLMVRHLSCSLITKSLHASRLADSARCPCVVRFV